MNYSEEAAATIANQQDETILISADELNRAAKEQTMCATRLSMRQKHKNAIYKLVKMTVTPGGAIDPKLVDHLVEKSIDEFGLDPASRLEIKAVVVDAIELYKRPTKNAFFAQQDEDLRGKKRKADNDHGRRREKKRQNVVVSYGGQPVSVDGTAPTAQSFTGTRHRAYSGTFDITYDALDCPPSPTHLDYPSVVWNQTGVPTPPDNRKVVPRQKLDPQRLTTWDKRDRRNYDDQNTVMGNYSAASVAYNALPAVEVDKAPRDTVGASRWEWLHLVSFKMGGINNRPQQQKNLVAGTYECNSLMISLEEAIKDLVLIDKLTLFVEVEADCHPGTHLGTLITYHVFYAKPDGSEIEFYNRFYPCVHINPASGDKKIFYEVIRHHFGLTSNVKFAAATPPKPQVSTGSNASLV
jgi:hypothetical protein